MEVRCLFFSSTIQLSIKLLLDLHLGNIGAAFPELDDQDPHHIMMKLDLYDMTVVLPISAAHQTPALPAYVTGPTELGGYYNDITSSGFPHTVILDFGGGELLFPTSGRG